MNICIVGCGAIGSLFAAHLARLEEVKVYAFDVSQEHVDAINEAGLTLSGAANFTAKVTATTDPSKIPQCQYGMVATKSNHTKAAIKSTAHIFADQGAVCSVQNGVGNEEILAKYVHYVIRGTTFPAGHIIQPGKVGYDIAGDTWIGPFEPSGTPMERVKELAELITKGGMKTEPLEDARGAQWTKLIFNAATNPVGALTLLHHGAATYFEPTGQLFEKLIEEGERVAEAAGVNLHGDPRDMVLKGAQAPGKHNASMLQDVLAGRPTEVEVMNGAIVEWGKRTGIPTPLHETVRGLVKGLEYSWTAP